MCVHQNSHVEDLIPRVKVATVGAIGKLEEMMKVELHDGIIRRETDTSSLCLFSLQHGRL
jgi:hypothetical protein